MNEEKEYKGFTGIMQRYFFKELDKHLDEQIEKKSQPHKISNVKSFSEKFYKTMDEVEKIKKQTEKINLEMEEMNNKRRHRHADLIKAWAEGAEIQFKNMFGVWVDVVEPLWYSCDEYRIKPGTGPNLIFFTSVGFNDLIGNAGCFIPVKKFPPDPIKLKLIYSQELEKFIKAEVIE